MCLPALLSYSSKVCLCDAIIFASLPDTIFDSGYPSYTMCFLPRRISCCKLQATSKTASNPVLDFVIGKATMVVDDKNDRNRKCEG